MEIQLYNQSSDKNVLNKNIGTPTIIYGTIKDESNLVNPEIILSRTVTNNFNYLYIPDFSRYYFVTDKIMEHQRTIIQCHVDVLMSFKNQIKNMNIIAERASNRFNLYQVDNELPLKNYKTVTTIGFTNGFSETNSYVLVSSGG